MFKQLAMPIALMGIMASLLLPMPPMVVDMMLVANLLMALVLLISTLYLHDPIKLSALPTILLLATLYRLSLNVSSTRLILSGGDAGQVIQAFGAVVIQGNLIVGTVIFLIITFIQFVVIAKGAERVAEVSARFTLDALPGKQLSIDADVRAGLIDFEQARHKRQDLQTESRFYGALDGAMKFVKGDAIAGIVVVAVNIIGGLTIGVAVNGMELSSALARYTLLTVGDGLVSQIPALLNSLAAGMVVTRVVSDERSSLAEDLFSQLWQTRKVKAIVAGLALILALVPGMPGLPFVSLALVLFFSAAMSDDQQQRRSTSSQESLAFKPKIPPVLELGISRELAAVLHAKGALGPCITAMQQEIYNKFGLILLPPELLILPSPGMTFQIFMRGIKVKEGVVTGGQDEAAACVRAELEEVVSRRAVEFVDDIHTRRVLDFFDHISPELVSTVIPGVISLTQLTEILKNLISEGVSIRNFDLILQAVAEHGSKPHGERGLYEEVRVALKRVISERYVQDGIIKAFILGTAFDLAIFRGEREGQFVDPDYYREIEEWLQGRDLNGCVLLCSKGARRLLYEGLAVRNINIPVLAHEELASEVKVQILGTITSEKPGVSEQVVEALAC